jgi:hypothetical protein
MVRTFLRPNARGEYYVRDSTKSSARLEFFALKAPAKANERYRDVTTVEELRTVSRATEQNTMVKMLLIAFLLAAPAFAQDSSSACGSENVSFNVTLDKSHPSLPTAAPGKATVVFIQDFGARKFGIGVHVIGRVGVDGSWVGAIRENSYLSVSLEPGEHHICVNLDSELLGNPVEFAHFRAEAGKAYYFRSRYMSGGNLLLAPVDSDEAKYQIAMFPLSISKPKK